MNLKKISIILLVILVSLALGVVAFANGNSMTIYSDTTVDAYGPLEAYAGIGSGDWGTSSPAVASFVHSAWGPGTSGYIDGATWISTDYCPEDPPGFGDTWRKYKKSFEICKGAYNTSGTLHVNSDNAEEAYFNGASLGSDGEVQGPFVDNGEWSTVLSWAFTPVAGSNDLEFITRNYAGSNECGGNPAALTFKADISYSCPIAVSIDIKPGSDPSCFNNDGHGVIPVAILGSETFDTSAIDVSTVSLEGLSVAAKGKANKLLVSYEDVDGDSDIDLVVKIEDLDGTFTKGSGYADVTGTLYDGTPFLGTGDICITQ